MGGIPAREKPVCEDRENQERQQTYIPVAVEPERRQEQKPLTGVLGQSDRESGTKVVAREHARQEEEQEDLGLEEHGERESIRSHLVSKR